MEHIPNRFLSIAEQRGSNAPAIAEMVRASLED